MQGWSDPLSWVAATERWSCGRGRDRPFRAARRADPDVQRDRTRERCSKSQLCYLCASVFTIRVSRAEEGWLLKHRGTEEHRGNDRGYVGKQ
jgi:hypothetical protein